VSGKKKPGVPNTQHGGRRKIAHIPLALETIPEARKTWASMIQQYNDNKMSSAKARDNNSFFKTLLGYLLAERDGRIEERLSALEAKLELVTPGARSVG
jgi:hypothetical protein